MRLRRFPSTLLVTFAAAFTLAAFSPHALALNKTAESSIDSLVERQMKAGNIPGVAVAVLDGDELFLRGYGTADGNSAVTPQTPFLIGSVGKTFTAFGVQQLIGAGQLTEDTKVINVLPGFQLQDMDAAQSLTVGHLLRHKSGFSRRQGEAAYLYNENLTIREAVKRLSSILPANAPGTVEEYSNLNFIILGAVIEQVSGQAYAEYLSQHVFAPLGMTDSFTDAAVAEKAGLAQGHTLLYGLKVPVSPPQPQAQIPAGFQMTSAEDMAKFAGLYLNNGYLNGTSLILNNPLPIETGESENRYGIYFTLEVEASEGLLGYDSHIGATAGEMTALLVNPEKHRAVIVLTNCNNGYQNPPVSAQTTANGIALLLETGNLPDAYSPNRIEQLPEFVALFVVLLLLAFRVFSATRFANRMQQKNKQGASLLAYFALDGLFPLAVLIGLPVFGEISWAFMLQNNLKIYAPVIVLCIGLLCVFAIKSLLLLRKKPTA